MQLLVKDLSFSYGARPIFSRVSFHVKAGHLWHIQGDNGCGKSTLLQTLLGLLEPQSGSYALQTVDGTAGSMRHHAAFVPPDANGLWGSLSASDNLQNWFALQHEKETLSLADCRAVLDSWGLQGNATQLMLRVDRFSTGMKRRLCFARLALSKSWLWILDEPLFGLDQKGVELVIQCIKTHLANQGAVLLVTHDTRPFQYLITQTLPLADFKAHKPKAVPA